MDGLPALWRRGDAELAVDYVPPVILGKSGTVKEIPPIRLSVLDCVLEHRLVAARCDAGTGDGHVRKSRTPRRKGLPPTSRAPRTRPGELGPMVPVLGTLSGGNFRRMKRRGDRGLQFAPDGLAGRGVIARRSRMLVVGLAALLFVGCSGEGPTTRDASTVVATTASAQVGEGRVVKEVVETPALANNIVGDKAERDVIVYLPPSYDVSQEARYPVVYFLAGAGENVGKLASQSRSVWQEMQKDGSLEFIMVEMDGQSAAMGADFYTNSPIAGNAEDALTEDLVAYVDATYRTIPDAASRGLSGFSMGGSGTINAGLRHPDVYSALYAFSPGLFQERAGLEGMLKTEGAWKAYGAAFSPDPTVDYPYQVAIDAHMPLADQDPGVVAAWESGYGNLRQKVADYLALSDKLTAIRVSYGTADHYSWIPEGAAYFLGLLEENGIPATSHVFGGGHDLDTSTFAEDYVSFFSQNLTA